MQDQFSSAKWPFGGVVVVPPLHLSYYYYYFLYQFWYDRRNLMEWNRKSNDVPTVHEGAHYRCGAGDYVHTQLCSSPGAGVQLLEGMHLFPVLPHRFSLIPVACCYLDSLLSPVWLPSTISQERSTFLHFTALTVSSQPLLVASVSLWNYEVLNWICSCTEFFKLLNDWNFYLDVCSNVLWGLFFNSFTAMRRNMKFSQIKNIYDFNWRKTWREHSFKY